ncbi:hypothetical protein C7820_3011 [Paenibacillus sp. VMFN-D1]|nr:hypothetical protein C7820_3011 [Paenibacillus sp. VMFN-D1]
MERYRNQKSVKKKGTIKQNTTGHFHDFWEMYAETLPESIEKIAQKAIKCGTEIWTMPSMNVRVGRFVSSVSDLLVAYRK